LSFLFCLLASARMFKVLVAARIILARSPTLCPSVSHTHSPWTNLFYLFISFSFSLSHEHYIFLHSRSLCLLLSFLSISLSHTHTYSNDVQILCLIHNVSTLSPPLCFFLSFILKRQKASKE